MAGWAKNLAKRFGFGKRAPARRDFAAAAGSRFLGDWRATNTSMNSDLYRGLDKLRARSRDLCNNNDYAKRFIAMVKANVVGGTGVQLQSRIYDAPQKPDKGANDAVEQSWERWCQRGICDVTGRLSFRDMQNAVIAAAARDGEPLIRIIRGASAGNAYGFALQLLDVDRIDTKLVRAPSNGVNEIKMGVEVNSFGRAVAYWLRPYHPGEMFLVDSATVGSHVRVPADDLIHPFVVDRPEQIRGLPWMHAAMIRLNHLGSYEEAAVIAARVGAAKMGFFTTPDGGPASEDGTDEEGVPFTEVEPGLFGTLPDGVEFTPFNPDYPHQMFEQFVKANLRGIASGFGVAYHALANDLTSVSFSSIRSGTLEERDQWMAIQEWFVEAFLEPVFREWIKHALTFGQVTLANGSALSVSKIDKFSAHRWQPRRWQWVDPRNDMEANILAIEQGFKSRQQICAELGMDFEDVLAQLKQEQDMAEQAGVTLGKPQPAAPADPAVAAAATGKAMVEAIATMAPPEVRVDSPVTVNSPVTVHTPEVSNTVEANLPEATAGVLEAAEKAAAAAVSVPEALTTAIAGLGDAQAKTIEALGRMGEQLGQKLDQVARISAADRIPVFDKDGNPTRSRVDLH